MGLPPYGSFWYPTDGVPAGCVDTTRPASPDTSHWRGRARKIEACPWPPIRPKPQTLLSLSLVQAGDRPHWVLSPGRVQYGRCLTPPPRCHSFVAQRAVGTPAHPAPLATPCSFTYSRLPTRLSPCLLLEQPNSATHWKRGPSPLDCPLWSPTPSNVNRPAPN